MTDAPEWDARDDSAAQMVSAFAANGFPRIPASVMIALMVAEEPALTAEQLGERTGTSPAAISGAVKYLSLIGMIHRHRRPGVRRFEYALPAHAWYTVSLEKNDLYGVLVRLSEGAAAESGPNARERLEEMADFFRFIQKRLPEVLDEWTAQRAGNDSPPN